MASNTKIGEVTKYDLVTIDNLQEYYYTYLNKNGLKINPNAIYSQVDDASRKATALTSNVYTNTFLTTDIVMKNNHEPVNNVSQLLILSTDDQEKDFKTLLNPSDISVNPNALQDYISIYVMNAFKNISTNTFKSTNAITIVDVNQEME